VFYSRLIAAAAVLLAFAPGALAQSTGIALVGPVVADHTAGAGDVIEGTYTVRNSAGEPRSARVYLQDFVQSAVRDTWVDPDSAQHSLASWTIVEPEALSVPPNGEMQIRYRIEVPPGTEPGTYWASLIVHADKKSTTSRSMVLPNGETREVTINAHYRAAKHLAVTVGPAGPPALAFVEAGLVDSPNGPALEVVLRNDGGTLAWPSVWAEVYDASGTDYGRLDGGDTYVFPRSDTRASVALHTLPPGDYEAVLFVESGDAVNGTRLQLTL
jgi:hypothetical protein